MLMIANEIGGGPVAIDPGDIVSVKAHGKNGSDVTLASGHMLSVELAASVVEGHLMAHMEHQQTISDRQLLGERVQ